MELPALGLVSYGKKDGNDFPDNIIGGRCPSNSICPNKHDICIQLTCTIAKNIIHKIKLIKKMIINLQLILLLQPEPSTEGH